MQITPHFTTDEMLRSATASAKGITNAIDATSLNNLHTLCERVLEPARERYGKPIPITSGYRCKALNTAVGGVANSQHLTGEAADLPWSKELFEILMDGDFDQLIRERSKSPSTLTSHPSSVQWIHVSCKSDPTKNRQQVITNLVKG